MKINRFLHLFGLIRGFTFSLAVLALLGNSSVLAHQVEHKEPKVQLAILLDTSGSMSGLIEQAKTQLWQIVNTFVEAEQNGHTPFVEVALYEYGNSRLHSGEHWIRLIQPLTRDLDDLSEDLFSLRTQGGEEYCGAVIQRATQELAWDSNPDVYKAIFIAGNEPFHQGPLDPIASCRKASAKGIFVNTIHCGGKQAGLRGGWQSGASIADGKFLNIDHNKQIVQIEAPQDQQLLELNIQLNATYIPMGAYGASKATIQREQDANAYRKKKSGAASSRIASKSSKNYWNGNWDLVDASQAKNFDWNTLKRKDLPKEMQQLSLAECKAVVEQQRQKRSEIQRQIQEVNRERLAYIAKEQQKRGERATDTLNHVMVDTVKEQAAKRGYRFEKK